MSCRCHQHGAPKCPEGERLYQADRDAYEALISAGDRYNLRQSEYNRHALHAAHDTYTEARRAWLNHKSTTDSERFMERAREFSNRGER